MLTVDVQLAVDGLQLPSEQDFIVWAQAAYLEAHKSSQVTVRVVHAEESRDLNKQYRDQDKPTNVLSFPMELPEDIEPSILGDIVVCADVVEREAVEQEKSAMSHWAHMIVHGVLHLQGYDHTEDEDAEEMEALEVEILAKMGIKNPYLS